MSGAGRILRFRGHHASCAETLELSSLPLLSLIVWAAFTDVYLRLTVALPRSTRRHSSCVAQRRREVRHWVIVGKCYIHSYH